MSQPHGTCSVVGLVPNKPALLSQTEPKNETQVLTINRRLHSLRNVGQRHSELDRSGCRHHLGHFAPKKLQRGRQLFHNPHAADSYHRLSESRREARSHRHHVGRSAKRHDESSELHYSIRRPRSNCESIADRHTTDTNGLLQLEWLAG